MSTVYLLDPSFGKTWGHMCGGLFQHFSLVKSRVLTLTSNPARLFKRGCLKENLTVTGVSILSKGYTFVDD